MKKLFNLRVKFLLFTTAVSLIIIFLSINIIDNMIVDFVKKETKKNMKIWINDFSNIITPLMVYFDYSKLYSQVMKMSETRQNDFIRIYDSNKKIVVDAMPKGYENIEVVLPLKNNSYLTNKKILGKCFYVFSKPIKVENSDYIWGYIVYGKSLSEERKIVSNLINQLLIILTIIFIFFILGFQIFLKIIINPLKKIKKALLNIYNGNLSYRLNIKSRDEFAKISYLFNEMAEKIEVIMSELEATQKNLETIVKERTRELNRTNSKLKEAIEELKRTQERIIQTEKQKSLTTIVAGFAHEINNPLSGILGYVDLLVQRDDISDYVKNKLYNIKVQSERIKNIVNDLDLLSPQIKKSELEINLVNLIAKLIKINKVASNGIKVNFDYNVKEKLTVAGNHYTLWQVFEAVFFNAVEAIKSGNIKQGIIEIKLYESVDGNNVVTEFRDNGGGFKDISKAFDPFYTTKQRANKRGIGLSIAYNLIKEHNGMIFLNNGKEGAIVTIFLPKYKNEKNNSKTEEK